MHSLSARLLVLTIFFVMLSEVFIFVPSVARYRAEWLRAKVDAAHLAMLALDAAPDRSIGEMLETKLLSQVGAHAVLARRGGARQVLTGTSPPMVDESFDLIEPGAWELIADALDVYVTAGPRVIRVLAPSSADPSVVLELVLDEAPLRADMIGYGGRILALSVAISLITATLVYLSLQWLMVRPMRRITGAMTAFSDNPEDVRQIITPSGRRDEVGIAERQLAAMQRGLHAALIQKAHLAALGSAVAKINHDLKGILSSALLVSDRLESSDDPAVRRLAPTLVTSIERATALCSHTLDYVGRDQPELKFEAVPLARLVDDVKATLDSSGEGKVLIRNEVAPELTVRADREQVFRILVNLLRNAADAGADRIEVSAMAGDGKVDVEVSDNGPGMPERARENLFKPFAGSTRAGGTGLGLAIGRELAQAHGGDLALVATGPAGTTFRLCLPAER